jgi:uncharacterized delta-60 repeat protein
MFLRNWFENLKTSGGLNSLKVRRRSPLRKRNSSVCFQAAEVFEERRLLSAGALDPTFGSGGTATPGAAINGTASAVAVYSNANAATAGDVVAAGNVALSYGNYNFALVRYTANGQPDPSFGKRGTVTTAFGSFGNAQAQALAIQGDGKIVAVGFGAGTTHGNNNVDFALARYNVNGSLDNSFGAKGEVTTNFGGSGRTASFDDASAALIEGDKIILAGVTCPGTTVVGAGNNIALARYNANGTLDTTFGSGGMVTTSHALIPGSVVDPSGLDGDTEVVGAVLQSDGKILVSGFTLVNTSPTRYATFVARYNPNGTLDTSFGVNGIAEFVPGFGGIGGRMAVEANGEILLASMDQMTLLQSNGTVDAAFGTNGLVAVPGSMVTHGLDYLYVVNGGISLEPNGEIVVSGGWGGGSQVARFFPNGSPDSTFGGGGMVTLPAGFNAIAIQPDGKIDLAGDGFVVDRLLPGEPQIGLLKTDSNPVPAGSDVTAIASVADDNPGATITQVEFTVEDSSGNIVTQGYGSQSSSGTRTFKISTIGWPPGTYTVIAQAEDSYGVLGDSSSITETLI